MSETEQEKFYRGLGSGLISSPLAARPDAARPEVSEQVQALAKVLADRVALAPTPDDVMRAMRVAYQSGFADGSFKALDDMVAKIGAKEAPR